MKLLIPLLLLSTTAVATELDYKTHFLFTWASSCVQKILPDFQRQGMPYLFAVSMASQGCGCVIDEFESITPRTRYWGSVTKRGWKNPCTTRKSVQVKSRSCDVGQ